MATLPRPDPAPSFVAPLNHRLAPLKEVTSPWGVASETGRLTDVLLSAPAYLEMVPCNAVTRESLAKGLFTSPAAAARQHRALVAALEKAGVHCHLVPPAPGLADLCFTRDAVLMTSWGLIELRPAAPHRRAEPAHVASAAAAFGVSRLGQVAEGTVEGGDVCLLREGVVLIGRSGDRTNEAGAQALGAMFERRGWEVIHTRFDPAFLHLDTLFTMVSRDCAVDCPEALEDDVLRALGQLGIGIIPASTEEVAELGANLLSLGDRRLLAPAGSHRLNGILSGCGFEVISVELDQFTRCGGGAHCLTMPLARHSDPAEHPRPHSVQCGKGDLT
jgi:N-dimethylarginine dimethylaminohydrolase